LLYPCNPRVDELTAEPLDPTDVGLVASIDGVVEDGVVEVKPVKPRPGLAEEFFAVGEETICREEP
jgi:hypothetical protein